MPDPATIAAIAQGAGALGGALFGGDGQQDPVGQIGFLPQASEQELAILMQALAASGGLAQDVSQIPQSLSLASLGAPVGGPTEDQRSLVEGVLGPQEDRLRAALDSIQARLEAERDQATRGLRGAQAASGVRGTTAGSADIGNALANINRPLSEFGRTATAELGGLRGQASQALLQLPFQERGLQLEARGAADRARAALMGNPVLERFFRERVAQGATVPLVPGETAVNPFRGSDQFGGGAKNPFLEALRNQRANAQQNQFV
jgi:hypothetical protein